jgi:YD repeat-containing protein
MLARERARRRERGDLVDVVTYDRRGHQVTERRGARGDILLGRDGRGLGRLMSITREDTDQLTMQYDAFGRESEYRRSLGGSSSGAHLSSYATPGGAAAEPSLATRISVPKGIAQSYMYDHFGRVVRSASNDPETLRLMYGSDRLLEGRLSSGKRTACV